MDEFHRLIRRLGLQDVTQITPAAHQTRNSLEARLAQRYFDMWCPGFDTLQLNTLAHAPELSGDLALAREALLAMLAAPQPMIFQGVAQLESQIRVRVHIAKAAAKTSLAFNTEAAERPEQFWQGDSENGFVIRHGVSLEEASSRRLSPKSQVVSMSSLVIEQPSIWYCSVWQRKPSW